MYEKMFGSRKSLKSYFNFFLAIEIPIDQEIRRGRGCSVVQQCWVAQCEEYLQHGPQIECGSPPCRRKEHNYCKFFYRSAPISWF